MSTLPVREPPPNMLADSGLRLGEALETAEQGGFWRRLTFDPAAWLRQAHFSPALAAAIFIVGFAGGIGTAYKAVKGPIEDGSKGIPPVESSIGGISGIRSVRQQPGSDQVTIKYDTVSTQQTQGSINDQRIQQLLLFAPRNPYSP